MKRLLLALAVCGCALSTSSPVLRAQRGPVTAAPLVSIRPEIICIDPAVANRARLNRIRPLDAEPGRVLFFDQQPPILSPDYNGTVTLNEFTMAGDLPSVQIQRVSGEVEVWQRVRMDSVAGRTVSVFQPSWPASTIDQAMALVRWGWDFPELLWGQVLGGAAGGGNKQIFLRIAPNSIPDVQVTRLADDVQYSGNVVNIVIPGFGDSIVQDDDEMVEFVRVASRFYDLFQDTYDAIAIVPQRSLQRPYSAVHHFVKNDVSGLGVPDGMVDRTAEFHSAGRLHSIELYPQFFATNKVSNHEASHQWASYVDWTAISGLTRAGHQPEFHDPLWVNYPSMMSAVLDGSRMVTGDGGLHLVKTPAPILYPPLTLYGMGVLPKDRVPDFALVDDQTQFLPTDMPAPGTPVGGGVRTATISNVVGLLGERSGPVPSAWDRATIVVSRGALLSQREMNVYTFFAQRLADPNRSGVISYEGYGSFDVSTSGAVDLRTDIRPTSGAPITQPLPVDFPNFGATDLRGLTLNGPMASRYNSGDTIQLAGRLTIPNASDFDRIAFRLTQDGVDPDLSLDAYDVDSRGAFAAQVSTAGKHGLFQLELFLITPSGGQISGRFQISTITIN